MIKRTAPRTNYYGQIPRGASYCIPVTMRDPQEQPIDLTDYNVAFTIKKVPFDFDQEDTRSYCALNFYPQDPTNGKFYIDLSSKDTYFECGKFFFDIELYSSGGAVFRIVTLEFDLVGGPTNRWVNDKKEQLPVGDNINIIIAAGMGKPIVCVTPIVPTETVHAELQKIYSILADQANQISVIQEQIADLQASEQQIQNTLQDVVPRVQYHEERISEVETRLTDAGL